MKRAEFLSSASARSASSSASASSILTSSAAFALSPASVECQEWHKESRKRGGEEGEEGSGCGSALAESDDDAGGERSRAGVCRERSYGASSWPCPSRSTRKRERKRAAIERTTAAAAGRDDACSAAGGRDVVELRLLPS